MTRPARPTSTRVAYWNEQRATWVGVYDGEAQGLDTDAGRWAIVCEQHGAILNATTLALAKSDAKLDPAEWCDECRAAEVERGTLMSKTTERCSHMHDDIRHLINARNDAIIASSLDLPLAQVAVVNRIERNNDVDAPFSAELLRNGIVEVEFVNDDIAYRVFIERDGYLDYTLGGALPELRKWNKPRGATVAS